MVKTPRLLLVVFAFWVGLTSSNGAVATAKAKPNAAPAKGSSKSETQAKSKTKSSRTRQARAPVQNAPTPDRIQEIQQALSSHGFPVDSTGALDVPTVDALRRFQEQQKLEPTGKLNSLTLIGLGLGPAQETASVQAYPPAAKE